MCADDSNMKSGGSICLNLQHPLAKHVKKKKCQVSWLIELDHEREATERDTLTNILYAVCVQVEILCHTADSIQGIVVELILGVYGQP